MKILLVSYVLPFSPSGVRFSYTQLAESLRTRGHEVDLVTPLNPPKIVKYATGALARILRLFGSKGKYISAEIGNFSKIFFSIDRKKNYDIVNAQDLGSAFAATKALRYSTPVILTCRFNDDPATEVCKRNEWQGKFVDWVNKWCSYQFSHVKYYTGVSDYVLNKAKKYFPVDTVQTKIYNAIDFDNIRQFEPSQEYERQFIGKKVIMNIGFLEKRKNQRYLIQLAEELKKYRTDFLIVIVGEGIDMDFLRKKVEEKNLKQYFIFTGQINTVFPILKLASLYFHTALNESFGRVLIEAIACNVPVIAFPVGGIPEILKKPALIDHSRSIEEVSSSINKMLGDEEFLNNLRKTQLDYSLHNFSIDSMTTKYIQFYNEVINDFKGIKEQSKRPIERHLIK